MISDGSRPPFLRIHRLGAGGMAEVWLALRAFAPQAYQFCALKCILPGFNENPDFIRLFYHEAGVSLKLNHPNCVHAWDCGVFEGRHFIAMEFMNGVTLDELMQSVKKIDVDVAVYIGCEILRALAYIHALRDESGDCLNIVHRDVCPMNIHIDFDGQCRLFDFGVCQTRGEDLDIQKGMIVGTAAYISPEQCRAKKLDGRSDLFSLAGVIVEMISGDNLFADDNKIKIYDAILNKTPELSAEIPGALADCLNRALQKLPEDRYECADRFYAAIRGLTDFDAARKKLSELMNRVFAEKKSALQRIECEALKKAKSPSFEDLIRASKAVSTDDELSSGRENIVEVSKLEAFRKPSAESAPEGVGKIGVNAISDEKKHLNFADRLKKWILGRS